MTIYITNFKKSDKKDKKYMIVFEYQGHTKTVHFGSAGMEDFTTHKDEERKQRYIKRHKANEDFYNPITAGALSRWILWNKPTIQESFKDYINRFGLKIKD